MLLGTLEVSSIRDTFWDDIYRDVVINAIKQFRIHPYKATSEKIEYCDRGITELLYSTRDDARSWIREFSSVFGSDDCHTPMVTVLKGLVCDMDGTESIESLQLWYDMRAMYNKKEVLQTFDKYVISIIFFGHSYFDKNVSIMNPSFQCATFSRDAIYRFYNYLSIDIVELVPTDSCIALVWWKHTIDFITTSNYEEIQRLQNSNDTTEANMGLQFSNLLRVFSRIPGKFNQQPLFSMRKGCTKSQIKDMKEQIDLGQNPISVPKAQMVTSRSECYCTSNLSTPQKDGLNEPILMVIYVDEVLDEPNFIDVDLFINWNMIPECADEKEVLVLSGLQLTYEGIMVGRYIDSESWGNERYGYTVYATLGKIPPELDPIT
jgi:hypothetical protein